MNIAIIDYGSGNLKSVQNAFLRIGLKTRIVQNPDGLLRADRIILPGVGAAKSAMKKLTERGFSSALKREKRPVLGICLGMQLFSTFSEEGDTPCLNLFRGSVRRFYIPEKVPHTGWNAVFPQKNTPLFAGISEGTDFYFVHSYFFDAEKKEEIANSDYGHTFSCAVQKDNFFGVQFHPEKSGERGERLLKNFVEIRAKKMLSSL